MILPSSNVYLYFEGRQTFLSIARNTLLGGKQISPPKPPLSFCGTLSIQFPSLPSWEFGFMAPYLSFGQFLKPFEHYLHFAQSS